MSHQDNHDNGLNNYCQEGAGVGMAGSEPQNKMYDPPLV